MMLLKTGGRGARLEGGREAAGARVDVISYFARLAPGWVLDAPVGEGREAEALAAIGHRVVGADLFARPERKGFLIRADLNDALPLRAGSFDYVLCREGIEHLENQAGFIRECARVLRPGGRLVITTPNIMNLATRVSALLTSQRTLRRGLINEVQTLRGGSAGRFYHGHVFLIDYFKLRYLLRIAGFEAIEVYADRWSNASICLTPLVPFMYLASRYSLWAGQRLTRRRNYRGAPPEVFREILGHVFSRALLYGRKMIVAATRARHPDAK